MAELISGLLNVHLQYSFNSENNNHLFTPDKSNFLQFSQLTNDNKIIHFFPKNKIDYKTCKCLSQSNIFFIASTTFPLSINRNAIPLTPSLAYLMLWKLSLLSWLLLFNFSTSVVFGPREKYVLSALKFLHSSEYPLDFSKDFHQMNICSIQASKWI